MRGEAARGTGVGIVRNMQDDTSLSCGFVVHLFEMHNCTITSQNSDALEDLRHISGIYETIIDFQVVGDVFTSKANIS